MEFNDLFNALDRFDKGVKGLQLQRSLEQANQQIEQIRGSELDSVKQQQALRDVAQGLTFQLASSGTPATTIEALTKSFQGEEAKVPTSFEQAILSGNPTYASRAIEGMGIKDTFTEKAQIRAQQAQEERDARREEIKANKDLRERTIPGLGVAVSKTDGLRLKKEMAQVLPGLEALDALSKVKPSELFSPEKRAIVKAQANAVRAMLRVPLVGGGAPSDFDQSLLDDIIKNPASPSGMLGEALFRTTSKSLQSLKSSIGATLKTQLSQGMESLNPENPLLQQITGKSYVDPNESTEPLSPGAPVKPGIRSFITKKK